jgi:hypothetical protein
MNRRFRPPGANGGIPPLCYVLPNPDSREAGRETVLGGQFDWGGLLLKRNGGVQRSAQRGWQSRVECKGTSRLDCEIYPSSRYESRP